MQSADLWATIEARTREAIACGALQPIETAQVRLEDGGVGFLVRVVSSLRRKAAAGTASAIAKGSPANPFLPPEPALTLGPISPTHLAVLNKFNVLERHLLIVTRARSTRELINALEEFNNLGVDFISYKENIDTSTPAGKILFTMISAFAEFERAIIRERVIAGMEKAKAKGARIGRPKIPPFTIEKVLEMKEQRNGYKEIINKLKISKSGYYKILQAVK